MLIISTSRLYLFHFSKIRFSVTPPKDSPIFQLQVWASVNFLLIFYWFWRLKTNFHFQFSSYNLYYDFSYFLWEMSYTIPKLLFQLFLINHLVQLDITCCVEFIWCRCRKKSTTKVDNIVLFFNITMTRIYFKIIY